MQKTGAIKYLIAAAAGGMLPLAYAPYNYYLLVFISPALLFLLWYRCSRKQAFYTGYVYGLFMFGIGVSWLHISINLFGGINLFAAYIITFTLVAFLALYPALLGLLSRLIIGQINPVYFLCVLPALWTLLEWCRSWIFTGFSWLNLGTSQTDTVLAAYAPVLGVYGISFFIAVIAGCISLFCIKRSQLLSVVIIITIFCGSLLLDRINWTQTDADQLAVTLVQGAIPQKIKWKPEIKEKTYQLYQKLSEPYKDSQFIIWPETAVPAFFHNTKELLDNIKTSVAQTGGVFLTGIPYKENDSPYYYNSILLIDDEYRLYKKHHLVPFGEYFPFRSLLEPILRKFHVPMSNFSAGNSKDTSFETRHGVLGLSICYEDAFGHEIRKSLPKAEVLVNVSNDAWFGDSIAPHQHLQIARMRSIETERYMVRSTNTGISAIIDHKGNIIAQSPQFQAVVLNGKIVKHRGSTPFILLGYWPILILCLLMLVVSVIYDRRLIQTQSA